MNVWAVCKESKLWNNDSGKIGWVQKGNLCFHDICQSFLSDVVQTNGWLCMSSLGWWLQRIGEKKGHNSAYKHYVTFVGGL